MFTCMRKYELNTPSLVKEIMFYFARFPERSGVMKMWNLGRSTLPEYDIWKAEMEALPDESMSLIPEIKNFVFGVDEDSLAKKITGFSEPFLFVDYGNLEVELDQVNRYNESFLIAITVAFPQRSGNVDLLESTIYSNLALDYIATIRRILIREEKERYWLKDFSADHAVTPWVSTNMPSIGWTIMFTRKGYDMLQGKEKQPPKGKG